ncbi:unnamed protein product [marine sediment metagenome]|uniref:Uncharacterized protein n=1 Tax=marine sediment metagenome TaxID=412755 RepID=X0ZL58_9ZZZZ
MADRNMMLTLDEYMAVRRLITSERESEGSTLSQEQPKTTRRRASAYNRRYKAAFKKVAPRYKLKNGNWRSNGFRSAVRAAHKMAKK